MTFAGQASTLLPVQLLTNVSEDLPSDLEILPGNPDNEGADEIFTVSNWRDVIVETVLENPTALWFLNKSGLDYFIPAIVACIEASVSAGNSTPGQNLFDFLEAKLQSQLNETQWKPSSSNSRLVDYARERLDGFNKRNARENGWGESEA